jgi:tellurite resistance protein TerC
MDRLRFLKVGVVVILAFVGVKILVESFVHVPVLLSLGVIAGVIAASAGASLWIPPPAPAVEELPPGPG